MGDIRSPPNENDSNGKSNEIGQNIRDDCILSHKINCPLFVITPTPQIIVSSDSDSDETIIINDDDDEDKEQRKPIKKKVVHRPEITEDKLNIETKQAMKEQTERDKRIQIQQEHEELARLERIRKQKEY
ncbi:unnamed protein product, partial [Rotaria sordida]